MRFIEKLAINIFQSENGVAYYHNTSEINYINFMRMDNCQELKIASI